MEISVEEILHANTYGGELLVDVEEINGEHVDSCAVLRADTPLPFYVGDRVCATLRVFTLEHEAFSESSVYQYRAKGAKVLLMLEDSESVKLLSSGANTLSARLLDLRNVLAHRISYSW